MKLVLIIPIWCYLDQGDIILRSGSNRLFHRLIGQFIGEEILEICDSLLCSYKWIRVKNI